MPLTRANQEGGKYTQKESDIEGSKERGEAVSTRTRRGLKHAERERERERLAVAHAGHW